MAFYFCLGRRNSYILVSFSRVLKPDHTVYSNSVLATLNARKIIRQIGETSDELSFSIQAVSKSGQGNIGSTVTFTLFLFYCQMTELKRSANISIKIDTIQEYIREQRQNTLDVIADPEASIFRSRYHISTDVVDAVC